MITYQLIKILEEKGIPSSFEEKVYLTVIAKGTGFKIRPKTPYFCGGLRFTYSNINSIFRMGKILDKIGIQYRIGNDDPKGRVKGNFLEILTKISRSSIKRILDHSCVALKFGDKVYVKFISEVFERIYLAAIAPNYALEKEKGKTIFNGWYQLPKKMERYVKITHVKDMNIKYFYYLNPWSWSGGKDSNLTVFFVPDDGIDMAETILGTLLSRYGFTFDKIVSWTSKTWKEPSRGWIYISNINPSLYSMLSYYNWRSVI